MHAQAMFRARGMLRESLARELDMETGDVFHFGGERCDRVVAVRSHALPGARGCGCLSCVGTRE